MASQLFAARMVATVSKAAWLALMHIAFLALAHDRLRQLKEFRRSGGIPRRYRRVRCGSTVQHKPSDSISKKREHLSHISSSLASYHPPHASAGRIGGRRFRLAETRGLSAMIIVTEM